MTGWILFYMAMVGVWQQSVEELLPWPLESISGCFGVSSINFTFFNPSCSEDERIAIDNLYALSKPRSTKCPMFLNASNNDLFDECCVYDEKDCKAVYNGVSRDEYFLEMTGKKTGVKPVARQDLTDDSCMNSLNLTTYMLMEFYCIKDSVIAKFDDNKAITAPAVYLANKEYPHPIQDSNTLVTCSVSVSCDSNITITAIHLQLHNNSTACTQSLDVIDGGHNTTFNCDDNTLYTIKTIYTSSSHFINVVFNSSEGNGTKLWLQFTSTHNADLTIACGTSALTTEPTVNACITTTATPNSSTVTTTETPNASAVTTTATPNSSTVTTTATPNASAVTTTATSGASTVTTTTTPNSSKKSTSKLDPDNGSSPGILAVAIVIPICVVVLVIIGSVFYFNTIQKRKRVSSVPETPDSSSSTTDDRENLVTDDEYQPEIDLDKLPTGGRGNSLPPLMTQQKTLETGVVSARHLTPVVV